MNVNYVCDDQEARRIEAERDAEVIYSYTRAEALADGQQVLLTGELADMARQAGWRYPVYITDTVWNVVEAAIANKKHCNDLKGVIWDILYMARRVGREVSPDTRIFEVIITGTGRRRVYQFYIQVGPTDIDNPDPALTIMSHEDR
jgi:hypothetical protein